MIAVHAQALYDYLKEYSTLNDREIVYLCSQFRYKPLKSNEVFIEKGKPVNRIGFLVSGILYALNTSADNRDEICYFIHQNQFFSERSGYYENKPAGVSIVVAMKSKVLFISFETLERLKREMPQIIPFVHAFGEKTILGIANVQSILTITDKAERMATFRRTFPHFFRNLSSRQLSRFMHINYSYFLHKRGEMA